MSEFGLRHCGNSSFQTGIEGKSGDGDAIGITTICEPTEDHEPETLKSLLTMDVLPRISPTALFTVVVLTIGVKRYRQTLD